MTVASDNETIDQVEPEVPPGTPEIYNPNSKIQYPKWRRPLLLAFAIVFGVRLVLSLWAAVVLSYFPTTDLQEQSAHIGIPLQTEGLAAPWQREDALWYEKIATLGYSPNDGTTAFLPLFPLLMRLASLLTLGNVALAGLLVSFVAEVIALALLYRLARLDGDEGTGLRSVLYLALFPTAFFLLSAFTESLFLALAIGAFWHARHGRWWLVALLTALAGLTKVQGALLCVPLAVEYLWSKSQVSGLRSQVSLGDLRLATLDLRPVRRAAEFAAVTLAGPLATLAFFGFIRYVVGDTMPWSERQNALWGHRVTWPGETLAVAVQNVLSEGQLTINTFDLLMFALFLGLAIAAFRLRVSYGLQALTVLAPSLLHVNAQLPLMSLSRYVLAAFPCFIVLAIWAGKRPPIAHKLLVGLFAALMLVWASQFVRGYWVG